MSLTAFHWEHFYDLQGKERQGKKKGGMEKKRRKLVKGKVENLKRNGKKYENEPRIFFFFFFF